MEKIDITEHSNKKREIDEYNKQFKEHWYNPMECLLTTIEQSQRLQDLGLDMSNSKIVSFFYVGADNTKKYYTVFADPTLLAMHDKKDYIHRYTLQEMLEKLPTTIKTSKDEEFDLVIDYGYEEVSYRNEDETLISTFTKHGDINNAVYDMLEWLLMNGY